MAQDVLPNKRTLIAISVGLVIILLRSWILNILSFLVTLVVLKYSSISQIPHNMVVLSKIINFQVIESIITIFAGGIVGYISRRSGWLYGLITGLIASAVYLHFNPLLLVETLIGGWVGEKIVNSQKKKFSV